MPMSFQDAEHIFTVEKRLLGPFRWTEPARGRNQTSIICNVELSGGSIPRGVFFRAIAYPEHLNAFTFQLECEKFNARAHITLYRLEVSPFRPHTNGFYGPDDLQGQYFGAGDTHEHDFHDSLTQDGELRAKPCDLARQIIVSPEDFPTARAIVCSRINIINGDDLPSPPAQGALL